MDRLSIDISIENNDCRFLASFEEAKLNAFDEIEELNETIDSLKNLKPQCDKTDYILAACSGALCGIMDIFLVGKPNESVLQNLSDKWFKEKTDDFAKLCGWNGNSSSIAFLERKFAIPYDQNGIGESAKEVFDLNTMNHHFKSLAHNPTLCGLFFSILDQYENRSHFITGNDSICLEKAKDGCALYGRNIPEKLVCAFVNWLGHLISDVSGSSSSKGRGMGIPSPFWAWCNDIIEIKNKLNIPISKFDERYYNMALEIYKKGYDLRFQGTQTIPVLVNEIITRVIYSVRRLIKYHSEIQEEDRSFKTAWKYCEPFSMVNSYTLLCFDQNA